MAFIATTGDQDPEAAPQTLGVVRTATKPDNSHAEFAIVVRSDLKCQGLGRLLMEKMIRYCQGRGTVHMTGQVLPDNKAMQALADKLGFDIWRNFEDEVVDLKLDLQAGEKPA
jgi:acetyltransferase